MTLIVCLTLIALGLFPDWLGESIPWKKKIVMLLCAVLPASIIIMHAKRLALQTKCD